MKDRRVFEEIQMPPRRIAMVISPAYSSACRAAHLGIPVHLYVDVYHPLLAMDLDPRHMKWLPQIQKLFEQLLYCYPAKVINPPF